MLDQIEIMDKIGEQKKIRIKECIVKAVQHYQKKLSDESLILSSLTKSSYIRDFIVKNISEAFSNDSMVEIKRRRGMILLTIKSDPIILLKFKKFNKYYRIASAKTMQALAYSNQAQGELFPEFTKTVHLHAGYKWDESYTQIDCLIGLPNSLTGHEWVTLIPETGNINQIIETTRDQIKKKQKVKIKKDKGNINEKFS